MEISCSILRGPEGSIALAVAGGRGAPSLISLGAGGARLSRIGGPESGRGLDGLDAGTSMELSRSKTAFVLETSGTSIGRLTEVPVEIL